jgi:CRISPR-associated endoribonuclease Cas6
MKSMIINLERLHGRVIPFSYNYYLAISLYSKLEIYQRDVRLLHHSSQVSMHTFSNIISNRVQIESDGLDIEKGKIVFRSFDPRIDTYLRLGLAEDPVIRISDTTYNVTSIYKGEDFAFSKDKLNFKSLSLVLVKDWNKENRFVSNPDDLEDNLEKHMLWSLENKFLVKDPHIKIQIKEKKPKTVRLTSHIKSEMLTRAFNIRGSIETSKESMKIIYYRGLGSKTSLGLGCIEVVE